MKEKDKTDRLEWIDVLRGIGIIFVTIGHIYSNSIIYNWIYSFHMPLFFFAAGWVYKEKLILVDIKRRIETIVIPYFTFGLLILLYWQFFERRFRNSDMGFGEALFGLFSGAYDNLDFNVHLWFLPCFFVTVVLFNILAKVGNKKVAYSVCILMSLIYVVNPLPELFWGLNRVFKYIGFYAIGTFLAGKFKVGNVTDKKLAYGISIVIFIILNFLLSYCGWTNGFMWFVTAIIGIIGMAGVAIVISNSKILQYFGKISLIILCIHGPVYRVLVKVLSILCHMSTDNLRENILISLFVVVITLMVCSVVYEMIVRIAPWMVGKRKNKYNAFQS